MNDRELEKTKAQAKKTADKIYDDLLSQLDGFFADIRTVRKVLERMDERQQDKWMRLHGRH